MINVCVFGDSVAKGVVFDEEKKKYIFLGDNFLKLVQERQPVKFRNFAKFGCTVTKGSLIMSKQRNVLSDYDYTILEFGGNDCDFDWNSVSESPFDAHRPQYHNGYFPQYVQIDDRIRHSRRKYPNTAHASPARFEQIFRLDIKRPRRRKYNVISEQRRRDHL